MAVAMSLGRRAFGGLATAAVIAALALPVSGAAQGGRPEAWGGGWGDAPGPVQPGGPQPAPAGGGPGRGGGGRFGGGLGGMRRGGCSLAFPILRRREGCRFR